MSKTFDILIDDYIKDIKFHKLEILPQMITKKELRHKKSSLNDNYSYKEKSNFIYGEIKCQEIQNKIKELIINNQNIIKINKNIFQNLTNLTTLNLSNNSISKISKKIVQLTNLKHLILNNNCISVIPFYLSDLIYLEEIQLENNLIQLIPIVIQNFNALKILNISSNKLEKLPVELGLIKNLEVLLIDKNEFVELPTSLCYLKKLKRIKLEWFEFVHPSIDIDLKDINIISSFKLILKERLLLSQLFIDFHNLIIKFSQDKLMDESINTFETEKTECYNNNSFDIFHALNNNYFGIIKSYVKDNPGIINSKDSNGKTPLYLSIQQGRKAIYEFFLSKIDVKNIPNNYSLLFKAIRMRNFPLCVKLNKLGISLDQVDEKGNNIYHILFSVFNKNYDQCCQIGNYFIQNDISSYNNSNNDGWGPIHIASKYGNYVCLEWINYINKILIKKNKEPININLLGKNKWTALHLAVSSYKYSECIKLLELKSNLFARNSDGRLPRYITNNFFLTKMLYKKEYEYYYNKLFKDKKEKKFMSARHNTNNKLFDKKNKINITNDNCYSYKVSNNLTSPNYKKLTQDLLSDNKYSLVEKYKFIMMLSLNDNKDEVEFKCKEILYKIDFTKRQNYIIISDILSIISKYNLTKLLPDLKKLKDKLNKKNKFLIGDFNNVIKYLEQIKNGKINIITKINIYINCNNSDDENNYNNRYQTSINQSNKSQANKVLLKRPGTINEMRGGKICDDEINCIKSIREKLMNNTSHKKNNNSNYNNDKNFGTSRFKKLEEKNIQESGNSVDFEFDETIKNL